MGFGYLPNSIRTGLCRPLIGNNKTQLKKSLLKRNETKEVSYFS